MIRHLGISNVTAAELAEARKIAPIACVQNLCNLSRRMMTRSRRLLEGAAR